MASPNELLDLSRHLKQERLFITSEREQLQHLNETVAQSAERLFHLAWIAMQQKLTLDQLILGSHKVTPEICFLQNHSFECVNFVDGYKYLSYHESKVGEFLKYLRENPRVVALCLLEAEKSGVDDLQKVAQVVVAGIYGSGIMPEDETYLLQVLKYLIEFQVAANDNPRRLLRRGSCAFSLVYRLLNEGMFAAKLFLTAALHKPVMQLLMDVEWFYDIDPERALTRFPSTERLRRFGQPGTKEYQSKTRQYRELLVNKLVVLTEHFLNSIKNSMYCFPQSLAWIISNLYQTVTKAQKVEPNEVRAICADLVLTFFICPAICDPEPFGITSDAPISYIARHNLMQIAQILQVLALDTDPGVLDPKTRDLYVKFERGCMLFLLDTLLDYPANSQPPLQSVQLVGCFRAAVLLTCSEIEQLVNLARSYLSQLEDGSAEQKNIQMILTHIPTQLFTQQPTAAASTTPNTTPQPTPPGTPSSIQKLKNLRDRKKRFLTPEPATETNDEKSETQQVSAQAKDVLVISLGTVNECPGFLPENKILEQEGKPRNFNSLIPGEDVPISESDIPLHEKRTRFSLSHDQDSIATSDNLEAISEAASSHSVGSDLDNENDNLSDMVSANVSGRGTPNISGRDTPLSQAGSQAEPETDGGAPNLPVIVQKSNREDVTERFGKFEIKQELERDETKSTVSDTWSTDVLASDSEPPEQTQYERLSEVAEEMARQNLLGVVEVSELSETTSDAWSVDVLASDTSERQMDRLLELEQDDMCSVSSRSQAQDDTSEVGDNVEHNEDTPQASGCQSPGNNDLEKSTDTLSGISPGGATNNHDSSMPTIAQQRSEYLPCSEKNGRKQRAEACYRFSQNAQAQRNQDMSDLQMFGSGAVGGSGDARVTTDKAGEVCGSGMQPDTSSDNLESNPFCSQMSNSRTYATSSAFTSPIRRSNQSDVPAMDALSTEVQDTLKISEQQHTKIDATRLSAVIDSFDPLSQENTVSILPGDNKSLYLENMNGNSDDLVGARPKVQHNPDLGTMPKIAFVRDSFDEGEACFDQASGLEFQNPASSQNKPKFPFLESGAEPLNSSSYNPFGDCRRAVEQSSQNSASGAPQELSPETLNNGPLVDITSSSLPRPSQLDVSGRSSAEELKDNENKKQAQDGKKKAGLLNIFKEKWNKGSKRKLNREKEDPDVTGSRFLGKSAANAPVNGDISSSHGSQSGSEYSRVQSDDPFSPSNVETSDDILDKYRRSSPMKPNNDSNLPVFSSNSTVLSANQNKEKGVSWDEEDESISCDSIFENKKPFFDAKKKLRLVLSTSDFQVMPSLACCYGSSNPFRSHGNKKENDLVSFLKVQLAEAINLQDKDLIAQLHETIRCLTPFDNTEIKKLLKAMKEEYRSRSPYIAYLVRCRQGLLSTLSHLDRLYNRVQRNKLVSNKYFITVLVRLFLEKRERQFSKFIAEFQQLTVSDEKTDLVERFLDKLNKLMEEDIVWKAANESQISEARSCIEWTVMSRIYVDAMYPNGEGDIYRDQILHDNIQKLSQVITPNHRDLRIPRIYHYECPWPAAQAEIYMINAYKTPKDKVQCIVRCSATVMNLLSMANEKSVPAADDFMPVLIYVLIKANPQSLLSTIQYVNSFYEKRMSGEEQYWWMQFCSAIEFIKTMIMNISDNSSTV